jgi:hypothetical protein
MIALGICLLFIAGCIALLTESRVPTVAIPQMVFSLLGGSLIFAGIVVWAWRNLP